MGIWVVATAALFFFVMPRFSDNLTELQTSHQQQADTYNSLRAQAASLQKMQQDLDSLKNEKIQPSDFFSNDLQLVNEIKQLETNAINSNVVTTLTIPVSADKAATLKGSESGLFVVPYSLKVVGQFPDLLKFLEYQENSFFIAPVDGINLLAQLSEKDKSSTINTELLGSFYIKKDAVAAQ